MSPTPTRSASVTIICAKAFILKIVNMIVNSFVFNFAIDLYRKHCLIKGLDDVGITLEKSNLIDIYENKIKDKSWVIPDFQNIKL